MLQGHAFWVEECRAMYQRLVSKIFKDMIGKTMEVYIDDMLVKNLKATNHIAHLEETFGVLQKHQMMLNPIHLINSSK